jgi:hypothetical protein
MDCDLSLDTIYKAATPCWQTWNCRDMGNMQSIAVGRAVCVSLGQTLVGTRRLGEGTAELALHIELQRREHGCVKRRRVQLGYVIV